MRAGLGLMVLSFMLLLAIFLTSFCKITAITVPICMAVLWKIGLAFYWK